MEKSSVSGTKLLISAAAFMWLVQIVNMMTGYQLSKLGIVPRELFGLTGVVFSPLLHWSIPHIIANTIPFLILGFLVHKTRHLFYVTAVVWIGSGLLVWLFARSAVHAGASGLIMGYFGFLISHGFYTRSTRSILIGLATLLLYGGIFLTLLDFRSHISFEGHIFGFITGVLAARQLGKPRA